MTGQNHHDASGARAGPLAREYGRAGAFGILTPQGNPTVEPEMRILLQPASAMFVSRLTSRSASLRQRLIDYGARLDESLAGFDGLDLDAVGFACTGSSYLVDPADAARRLDEIQAEKGYQVVTAAKAISDALKSLGVGAIALISPYPEWLTVASREHWERSGIRVTIVLQLSAGAGEAHGIYGLTTPVLLARTKDFVPLGAEAILVSGTGMPSLRTILALEPSSQLPVLSSNLCLAWALARLSGQGAPGPESRLYGGWSQRLLQA
jgi:maleate isomerase